MGDIGMLKKQDDFEILLFEKMKRINLAVNELEPYEFCYALKNLIPDKGWDSVEIASKAEVEQLINDRDFYTGIQTRNEINNKIILDGNIVHLTRMLFAGLVSGDYPEKWIKVHFYFDVRGFLFFHRISYFSEESLYHFGGKPFKQFKPKQLRFEPFQGIGYKDFMEANAEIDQAFIDTH